MQGVMEGTEERTQSRRGPQGRRVLYDTCRGEDTEKYDRGGGLSALQRRRHVRNDSEGSGVTYRTGKVGPNSDDGAGKGVMEHIYTWFFDQYKIKLLYKQRIWKKDKNYTFTP